MNQQNLAFELEAHMIPWNQLETCGCPTECIVIAKEISQDGVPTGFGQHPFHGWFVICTAGQGPVIVFLEKCQSQPNDPG